MATFPSVDLTNFDLAPAARTVRSATNTVATRATDLAKDVTYTAVGLGLLTFQRMQVRRREFEREVRST